MRWPDAAAQAGRRDWIVCRARMAELCAAGGALPDPPVWTPSADAARNVRALGADEAH